MKCSKHIFAFVFLVLNSAFASQIIVCEPVLPADNAHKLPSTWMIEINETRTAAHLIYPGAEAGVLGTVTSGILPSEEYTQGFSINEFGYRVGRGEMHILVAFKESLAHAKIQFRSKLRRFSRGTTVLAEVNGNCKLVD